MRDLLFNNVIGMTQSPVIKHISGVRSNRELSFILLGQLYACKLYSHTNDYDFLPHFGVWYLNKNGVQLEHGLLQKHWGSIADMLNIDIDITIQSLFEFREIHLKNNDNDNTHLQNYFNINVVCFDDLLNYFLDKNSLNSIGVLSVLDIGNFFLGYSNFQNIDFTINEPDNFLTGDINSEFCRMIADDLKVSPRFYAPMIYFGAWSRDDLSIDNFFYYVDLFRYRNI